MVELVMQRVDRTAGEKTENLTVTFSASSFGVIAQFVTVEHIADGCPITSEHLERATRRAQEFAGELANLSRSS